MRLSQWLEEKQRRNWQRITPKQAQTIEKTWQKASRHGMTAFILTRSLVLLVWSSLCLVFFGWLAHTLPVMRQPFYLATVIPCLLFFSVAVPTMFYLLFRYNARKARSLQPAVAPTA